MTRHVEGRWGTAVTCGPFTAERYGPSVRWLRFAGIEYVRMLGLVVRDASWRTMLPEPATLRTRTRDRGLAMRGRTRVGRGSLDWSMTIAGAVDGCLVRVVMTARGTVMTNRTGLVVLLPAERFAGARYYARYVSRRSPTRGRLPIAIAPHQPLVDLAALSMAAPDGAALSLVFTGDTFEMEDQRNWLDPTFKLYNRALALAVPYRIGDGERIEQSIAIAIEARASRRSARPRRPLLGRLPQLGVATVRSRIPRDAAIVRRLAEARPRFVTHIAARHGHEIASAARFAQSLEAELHLHVFGNDRNAADAVRRARPAVVAIHLAGEEQRRRIHALAPVATGTYSDFVLLNRARVASDATRLTFALCPTVHARDDRSLIESLAALTPVFRAAKAIAGARPIDVGPCALRRALLPKSGDLADRPRDAQGRPHDVDERQGAPIAAAWLATAVAMAAAARIETFCTFEAAGARGLVGMRERFPVTRAVQHGRRTPAFAVLQALGDANARLILYDVDEAVGAAFLIEASEPELWLVDLRGRARPLPHVPKRVHVLCLVDASEGARWSAAARRRLQAYGVARIVGRALTQRTCQSLANAWCAR